MKGFTEVWADNDLEFVLREHFLVGNHEIEGRGREAFWNLKFDISIIDLDSPLTVEF